MWRQAEEESTVKISPNVLKNFKVFDILEPQKNGAKNSDEPNVDKLIDIDDSSRDSGFSEVNASFMDKNKDYDLIDVFQNMFVTPQLIKKKDTKSCNEVTNASTSKTFDDDFKHFLDIIESGQKIDWTKISGLQKKDNPTGHPYEFTEKPKVLVPKINLDSDSDPEELINEILLQKKLEEHVLKQSCSSAKTVNDKSRVVKDSKSTVNLSKHTTNHVSSAVNNIEMSDVTFGNSRKSLNNNFIEDNKFECKNNSYSKTTPIDSQINNSLYNFKLIAMKRDEKLYKKNRLVRPESQTSKYTKGPDFYEKSVVLPQIMARLTARQAYLDEKNNHKKRLVLDAGIRTHSTDNNVSKTPNAPKSKSQKAESSFATSSVKTDRVTITKDTKLCINTLTHTIAVHNKDDICTNCNKKTKTPKVEQCASVKTDDDYGKLSPKVLLDDCNRERLKDWMLSQRFKNFVQNGF